jgi:hypothetical protein
MSLWCCEVSLFNMQCYEVFLIGMHMFMFAVFMKCLLLVCVCDWLNCD